MVAKSLFFACTAVAVSFVAAPVAARPAATNTTSFLPFSWENFDMSVNPANDFDNYVNGGWKKAHLPLPADKNSYSAFAESADYVKNMLKNLFDQAQTSPQKSLFNEIVKSGMDVKAQDKAGIKPIQDQLKLIASAKSAKDLVDVTAALHREALGVSFTTYSGKDPQTPINVIQLSDLSDSELGIPRDYYLNASDPINGQYKQYLQSLFQLSGSSASEAKSAAESVWKLEGALAKASLSLTDRGDVAATYNKMSVANLTATSGFDFPLYFRCLGVPTKKMGPFVIVNNPAYFVTFGKMFAQKNLLESFKNLYKASLLSASAPYLTQKFQDVSFNFSGKIINGQEAPSPRWENVFAFVEAHIQDTIAKPFVEKAFSAKDKETVAAIFEGIRGAFGEHVKNRDWLSAPTKQKALAKLAMVTPRIAYPDKWETYAEIKGVSASKPYATNRRIILAARTHLALMSVGQKPDATRWDMSPTEVNAYYDASVNGIVVTTGMLTPPNYFSASQCPGSICAAYNWGSMAAGTLGHELSHGFDSDGRLYDGTGKLDDWWTAEDNKNFESHAQKIIDQFNQFTLLGLKVNGEASVGENTADLGGLAVGFTAFQNYMAKNGRLPDMKIPGPNGKSLVLTPEQQYFAGYAVSWREVRTDASIRKRIATDVHAPAHFRINGPMANLPDFWKAFNAPAGSPEHASADKLVNIW
ncbi:hypothetical protein HDU88_000595 [Geranomyces variabilis]|nr:hypothetical protein HDU88_000595 [Geranomyces variabilis]